MCYGLFHGLTSLRNRSTALELVLRLNRWSETDGVPGHSTWKNLRFERYLLEITCFSYFPRMV